VLPTGLRSGHWLHAARVAAVRDGAPFCRVSANDRFDSADNTDYEEPMAEETSGHHSLLYDPAPTGKDPLYGFTAPLLTETSLPALVCQWDRYE
jgi:hypothetical protein